MSKMKLILISSFNNNNIKIYILELVYIVGFLSHIEF